MESINGVDGKLTSAEREAQVRGLSDGDLKEQIARMFSNWCWVSGDPEEKAYYGLLLEEAERRNHQRQQREE